MLERSLTSRLFACSLLALPLAACGDDDPGADTDGGTDTDPTTMTATMTMTGPTTTTPDTETDPTIDPDTGDTDPDTDTDTDTDTETGVVDEPVAIWTTANPGGRDADRITSLAPALDGADVDFGITGEIAGIQSVTIDDANDGWATFDLTGGGGGLMFIEGLGNANADGTIGLGTRVVRGPVTGLMTPKGVIVIPDGDGGNIVLVADTMAGDMKGYATDAEGDAAPVLTIDDLGSSSAVWDMFYDAGTDALYASGTNGDVQIYDNFAADQGADGPTRTVTPAEDGTAISVNLHGVGVFAGQIILTDVGDAMSADDGQIFVIDDAANADGTTDVFQRIQDNMLGNPVDLLTRTGAMDELYIAEKSNSMVLSFTRLPGVPPATDPGDYTPRGMLDAPGAESLWNQTLGTILATTNPAGFDGDSVSVIGTGIGGLELAAALTTPGTVSSQQSMHLLPSGDAWVTFDGPESTGGGGLFRVSDVANFSDEVANASADRIWGPATGIVAPKGLDATADGAVIFVADVGAGDIKVFTDETGDRAPEFVIDAGDSAVWDVDYDEANDRLYASGVNGTVRVFDEVSVNMGADGPTRTITPTDGSDQISVNLHGIVYDAASDSLLLTDVGDAASAEDGQIFVIAAGSTAEGDTEVVVQIGGGSTALGNPVDCAFDGQDLYVAEKSNSAVLRYDGILDLAGALDVAEDATIEVANAESVQVEAAKR